MSASGGAYKGDVETARQGVSRMPGATERLKAVTYMDLYEHSVRLGRLTELDGRSVFAGAGVLLLGGGIGAWASGSRIGSTAVLLCVIVGLVLFVASLFVRRANVESATNLKEDFDRTLSLYEKSPVIQEMRRHFESKAADHEPPIGTVRKVLRKVRAYLHL